MIVVTDHGDGAVIDQVHHRIDRPFRIGAIADDIAEADEPLRTAGAREIETRAERLPVGMDIGKDGQPHISSPSIIAAVPARVLRDIKQQVACGVQSGRVRLQAAIRRSDLAGGAIWASWGNPLAIPNRELDAQTSYLSLPQW